MIGVSVHRPRCWLEIGGARVPCINASVHRTAKRNSDTFSALLSITETATVGYDLAKWVDWEPVDVSIVFASALDGSDQRTMITGKVDEPNVAWKQMTVSISGRDKSASLTEKRRNEKFNNQKPADIVKTIAKDHGLTAVVQGGDGDFAGKLYAQDTSQLVLNKTDFETLSDLAEKIGFRWFVDGLNLYFEPKGATGEYNVHWTPPVPGRPMSADVIDLTVKRNMSAARPHKVNVKSWHHRQKKLFKGLAEIDGKGDPLIFNDLHNGKTQQQVDELAKSRLNNAVRHEFTVTVQGPGDLTVDVRQKLNLSGTGTVADQSYDIDSVDFDIGWQDGFVMTVTAKSQKEGRESKTGTSAAPSPTGETLPPITATQAPLPPPRPSSDPVSI